MQISVRPTAGTLLAAGEVPESVGAQAKEIRFDLQKSLIQIDARIETSRLEASEFRGARGQRALDALLAAGAERERILFHFLSRLEALTGRRVELTPGPVAPVSSPVSGTARERAGSASKVISDVREEAGAPSSRHLRIESVPEDVTQGEFE